MFHLNAGGNLRNAGRGSVASSGGTLHLAAGSEGGAIGAGLQQRLAQVRGLYKGVVGAATGAGIIIGTYFAFYSTTKNFLRRHSSLNEGEHATSCRAAIH